MTDRAKKLLGVLLLVIVAAMVVNSLGEQPTDGDDRAASAEDQTNRPTPTSPYAGEVDDGRSYGALLATEMDGPSPPSRLVDRFNRLIDQIANSCGESRQWACDRILTGHQTLTDRGGNASLMDVAAGWREAVQGSTPADCTDALSALLMTLEQEG